MSKGIRTCHSNVQDLYCATSKGAVTILGYTGCGGAVTIPESINGRPVTGIGRNAFYSCTTLTGITLPHTVTSIGEGAFQGCINLATITVDQRNPRYQSVDGVLFNKRRTTLIQCPGAKAGQYVIPVRVTSIGKGAFYGCYSLTHVVMPSTVTRIGEYAFFYCDNLANVSIPDSVTTIGVCAFQNCGNLTSITISARITVIKDYTFAGCGRLLDVVIPDSVTAIGNSAFYDCTCLAHISLGKTVTSIGAKTFEYCSNLLSIVVNAGNPAYESHKGVLFDKRNTTLLHFPAGKAGRYSIPNGVSTIASRAFYDCNGLTHIKIPYSVTIIGMTPASIASVGDQAFCYCGALMAIDVEARNPSYCSVDGVLFDKRHATLIQCPAGKTGSYSVPNGAASIRERAFECCAGVTSITFPASIEDIRRQAFIRCSGLTGMYFRGNGPQIFREGFPRLCPIHRLPDATGWDHPRHQDLALSLWEHAPDPNSKTMTLQTKKTQKAT